VRARLDFWASRSSAVQWPPPPQHHAPTLQANSDLPAFTPGHRAYACGLLSGGRSIELLRRDPRSQCPAMSRRFSAEPRRNLGRNVRALSCREPRVYLTPTQTPRQTSLKEHFGRAQFRTLSYSDREGRAHLRQMLWWQSAEQRMLRRSLDLYSRALISITPRRAKCGKLRSWRPSKIIRAVGPGGVLANKAPQRRPQPWRIRFAATVKFVMSGGNPTAL